MTVLNAFLLALGGILAAGFVTWLISLVKRDVSIVDSLWSLMFLLAALIYLATAPEAGATSWLVVVMVGLWAVRLSAYITWRNWGDEEDRRYQQIRARNQPHFAIKSLFLVFVLQGVLAWIISLPLLVAIHGDPPLALPGYLALTLWLAGMVFEAGADWQLARFKADPVNKGKVLDTGLWRYTRHPNYFGNALVWWGFFLLALSAGGWWTVVSPLLMTFLLLKVSGVALLEKDIADRRPEYRAYVQRTNAFFPGPPHEMEHPKRQPEVKA
jgi:steroid 5-alpha reductase family enzyme